jgi:acetylornithine deacetylase/succinyl-diaminopimelate desuccinylase-like protein
MITLTQSQLHDTVEAQWRHEIVPALTAYIRIPNKSPAFAPNWAAEGHMDRAVDLLCGWARERLHKLPGATLEVLRLPGRTPLILIDVPGKPGDTVMLYGHLDKQPEMTGWAANKGPWVPVIEDDKLYGRGGADDGYAMFGSLAALFALKEQGVAIARCVVVIEASEESGSPDLPAYMELIGPKIGDVGLIVCLDSGCGDYDRLWVTTSLRGLVGGNLRVEVLSEGVHSGDASGVVPSSFRILRQVLNRIENPETGEILLPELQSQIPPDRRAQAQVAAAALGDMVWKKFPFMPGMTAMRAENPELVLNRTWRPTLSVVGFEGAPDLGSAGNVLRPQTAVKLSIRLPPTADAERASAAVKRVLEANPPYGARVTFEPEKAGSGWNAPETKPWLMAALDRASDAAWGKPAAMMGEGGSIPFMGMLGQAFPRAQFVVTGVLGPNSNAHGPNEFLHIPTGIRVTETVAHALAAHAAQM